MAIFAVPKEHESEAQTCDKKRAVAREQTNM